MHALVVLSGGQDSTTCLYWAQARNVTCEGVFFDYGQRHLDMERESAKIIAKMAGIPLHVLPINTFTHIGNSALIEKDKGIGDKHEQNDSLPASFVPGRNLILLTFAASLAYSIGVRDLYTGVNQTDYSGYPDCRAATIRALESAISYGLGEEFRIHTPLIALPKKDIARVGNSLNGCMEALAYSHTCYEGKFPPCGVCPSCVIRARGFEKAGLEDPLMERAKKL